MIPKTNMAPVSNMSDANRPMRIIFFGTPAFSRIILEKLYTTGLMPVAVVTGPDAPAGRGNKLTPSEVKIFAQIHAIPVLEPLRLKDETFLTSVKNLKPDIFVIASYGKFLPQSVLDAAPQGVINVHPSLLPKYRGPTPIQTAILNRDETTGVTLMLTDVEMDHGPIIKNTTIQILNPKIRYQELHDQLAILGAELLVDTLPQWLAGKIKPREQNHTEASSTKLFTKADGRIDWHKSGSEIERQIRAFEVWPGSWTELEKDGKKIRVKIIAAEVTDEPSHVVPGTITKTKNGDLAVCTNDWLLVVTRLQAEGGKEMSGEAFLNGHAKTLLGSHLQ